MELSELPEDIIYQIFSHLSNQDAVRLSLVSKQVSGLVQQRPTLDFNYTSMDFDYTLIYGDYLKELNYIYSTLSRYHRKSIRLETFTLSADALIVDQEGLYYRCVELAAKPGLRNLKLCIAIAIPQHVFQVESLVELELMFCTLNPNARVVWPNLKRLSISQCRDEGSQEVFEKITRGCPSIENLQVISSYISNKLEVANLLNLKKLNVILCRDQRLEVSAVPNLESIVCDSGFGSYGAIVNLGDTEYTKLTSLELKGGGIDGNLFINFGRKFPILEKLCLTCNQNLQRINLSSTSLKEIELINLEQLQKACFDVPNIAFFKYSIAIGAFPIYRSLPKLSFAGNSGGWSSCIQLYEYVRKIDSSWFMELNEMLLELSQVEANSITLTIHGKQVLFNKEEHRALANSAILVRGIRELIIHSATFSRSSENALLDYIFLICQPQIITFRVRGVDRGSLMTLMCVYLEKLISTSRQDHLGSVRFKDWDKLLEVLKADENKAGFKNISFHLEY